MNAKLITACVLAMVSLHANVSAQEQRDTVKTIEDASKILITRQGNKTTLEADYIDDLGGKTRFIYEVSVKASTRDTKDFNDDWGMDLPFFKTRSIEEERDNKRKVRTYRDVTGLRHIYWGWRFNYCDKGNIKNCFEVGIRDLIGFSWKRRGAELEIGAGFGFKRLLADDGFVYGKEGDKISLFPWEEDGEVKHSRLDVFQFHIPVIYTQRIYKALKFSIGGIVNLNTYAKAFTESGLGKANTKWSYKGLQQNLLTVDGMASLNLGGVGIYGSWSPMRMFDKTYGPAVKGWSIGIDLDF